MKFEEKELARATHAYTFFRAQKWSRPQALGIVGNLQAESGVDPNRAQSGGGPGYGIAQWERPRQADFKAWAGHDIRLSTMDEQLAFVQHELETTQRGAATALRASSTPQAAAAAFCETFERPADTAGQMAHRADVAAALDRVIPDFDHVRGEAASTAPTRNDP